MSEKPSSKHTQDPVRLAQLLSVLVAISALVFAGKQLSEWQTPEQSQRKSDQAVEMNSLNNAVSGLQASTMALSDNIGMVAEQYNKQNEILQGLATTVATMAAQTHLKFEGVDREIKNLWDAPRPDNTQRAMSNTEKNIEQDGVLNNHEYRIQRIESLESIPN